jgi:hypothetical protein
MQKGLYFYYSGIGCDNGGGVYTINELRRIVIQNNHLFKPPFPNPYQVLPSDLGALDLQNLYSHK